MRGLSCRRVARALPTLGVPMALAGCTGEGASIGGIAFVAVLLGALAAGLAYLLGRAHGAAAAPQPVAAAPASGPQTRDAVALAIEAPPPPPAPTPAELAAHNAAEQDSYSFTLSHDLRAPLRVVEGFTRIVKEDYGAQLDRVGNDLVVDEGGWTCGKDGQSVPVSQGMPTVRVAKLSVGGGR